MSRPFRRTLAASLALCAMLVRALLPAGWMPNPTALADAAPYIICSGEAAGAGTMPMAGMDMAGMPDMAMAGTLHMDGKAPSNSAGERTHAPCAFAAVAHLAPPALAPALAALPAYAGRAIVSNGDARSVVATSHRPQSARAPPVFS